jgi:hypothetical protein
VDGSTLAPMAHKTHHTGTLIILWSHLAPLSSRPALEEGVSRLENGGSFQAWAGEGVARSVVPGSKS